MFDVEKDNTLHVHKGDRVVLGLTAKDKKTNEPLLFKAGDIVRIKVYRKNNVTNVLLEKNFLVETPSEEVYIYLDSDDTSFGGNINKVTEYSYEVSVNPDTPDEDTIIGHFTDGPVSWFHYPEGAEIPKPEINPEDIPVVDDKLDINSERPVQNKVIAAAAAAIKNDIDKRLEAYKDVFEDISKNFVKEYSHSNGLAIFEFFELSAHKRGKTITVNLSGQLKERYNTPLGGYCGFSLGVNEEYMPLFGHHFLNVLTDGFSVDKVQAVFNEEGWIVVEWEEDFRPQFMISFTYFCK